MRERKGGKIKKSERKWERKEEKKEVKIRKKK